MTHAPRLALPDEVPAIGAVLAAAFSNYPWTRWTVEDSDHSQRLLSLQQLVLDELIVPYGEAWVIDDAAGIVTAALWMRPGIEIDPQVQSKVAAQSARLEGNRHLFSVHAEQCVAAFRPKDPHYFLGAVGTRPQDQGRGFGARVLRPVLERASAEGAIVHLETSLETNVAFYERHGFTVENRLAIPDGGPHVWTMSRAPARDFGALDET